MSTLLLSDNPLTMSSSVRAIAMPGLTGPWRCLGKWFQGEAVTAFATSNGVDFWDYACADSEVLSTFSDAMARDSQLVERAVLEKPELRRLFEGLGSLVDVGGGTGTLAKAVAAEFPETECVVFDLPHVVAGLEGSHNLKFIGGSMFEAIPPGEALVLKWVLHDWADEESVKILEQCKKAITNRGHNKKGKVIIIDMVIGNNNNDSDDRESLETQLFFDMQMMVLVDGRERNEKEWARLFSDAGFSSYKITRGLGIRSIIEVYP